MSTQPELHSAANSKQNQLGKNSSKTGTLLSRRSAAVNGVIYVFQDCVGRCSVPRDAAARVERRWQTLRSGTEWAGGGDLADEWVSRQKLRPKTPPRPTPLKCGTRAQVSAICKSVQIFFREAEQCQRVQQRYGSTVPKGQHLDGTVVEYSTHSLGLVDTVSAAAPIILADLRSSVNHHHSDHPRHQRHQSPSAPLGTTARHHASARTTEARGLA